MERHFSFFILVNTKSDEFEIFCTAMKDYRLRLSAMKSAFKRWADQDIDSNVFPYREYFRFFQSGYETCYLLERKYMSEVEAHKFVNILTAQRSL